MSRIDSSANFPYAHAGSWTCDESPLMVDRNAVGPRVAKLRGRDTELAVLTEMVAAITDGDSRRARSTR